MKLVNVCMSTTHVDTFAQVYTFQCLWKMAIRGSLGNRYKENVFARLPTHSVMSGEEEITVLYRS